MKTIPLSQGKVALVDDADFEAVSQFKWYANKVGRRFYAARKVRKPDGNWTHLYMHKVLLPGAVEVDHRDGNSLNNQKKSNLRPATRLQNAQGFQRKRPGTTSKFRGVTWDKSRLKWIAQITVNKKHINLGRFINEVDAARAYDAAARKYFVEGFLHLNFP